VKKIIGELLGPERRGEFTMGTCEISLDGILWKETPWDPMKKVGKEKSRY
jgi:hypothetical protein